MDMMNIPQLVRIWLPWLTEADNDKVQAALTYQCTSVQPYSLLGDDDSEDLSKYSKLARLLLADLTAYQLVVGKASESGGNAEGGRAVKRVKADVVETEFESVKASDSGSIALATPKLLEEIRKSACAHAKQLGWALRLCAAEGAAAPSTGTFVPFITIFN